MKNLLKHREAWPGKSDEWLFERVANELSDKVSEIHLLLNEIESLKDKLSTMCDCQDFENGLISMHCKVHNENAYPEGDFPEGIIDKTQMLSVLKECWLVFPLGTEFKRNTFRKLDALIKNLSP